MALYRNVSWDEFNSLGTGLPTPSQTRLYNALGRNSESSDDNFFTKRAKSIDNAIGTTGAAVVSAIDSANENKRNEDLHRRSEQSLNDIYKSAGFNNSSEYQDAKDATLNDLYNKYGLDIDDYYNRRADLSINDPYGTSDAVKAFDRDFETKKQEVKNMMTDDERNQIARFDDIDNRVKNQVTTTANEKRKAQENWKDYRENSDVGKRINQDRGKFLGSAINTLSTAFDVMAPGAGVLANSVQGGIEGIADELEQNGLENFDWERAGQNALTGATVGAVTGGLNKGISSNLAKKGGNLFKGGNALTRGLNTLGSSTTAGRIGSTLATGAARGAVSGAVGGATGAGLSAAMNGQDVLGSAIQGAQQGFGQGALAGSVMAGANMAANATPGVGNVMRKFNEAGENFNNSGDNTIDRIKNTWNSGESPVANRITEDINAVKQGFQNVGEGIKVLANRSGVLDSLQNIGMGVKNVADTETIPQDIQNMRINNPYDDTTYNVVPKEDVAVQRVETPQSNVMSSAETEPFMAYGNSDLASGKMQKQNILSKAGRAMQAAQSNATRKETRDIGIESSGELINKVRQRTGLSDLEKQAAFAKELTGGDKSLLDRIQSNAIAATEDGSTRSVDLTSLEPRINKLVDDAPNTLISPSKKEEVKSAILADLRNGGIDTIRKANNFKSAGAQQFLINERTPNDSAKELGKLYMKVGDIVDEASYAQIPQSQVEAMFEIGANEARARAQVAANKGQKEYEVAYNRLADELDASPKTIPAFRNIKKDYVDISKLNKKTQQGATAWNNNPLTMGTAITAAMATGNPLAAVPAAWAAKTFAPAIGQAAIDTSAKLGGKLADWGDNISARKSGDYVANTNTDVVDTSNYNPNTRIYDIIGRSEGLSNAEQARTADYLINAAQEAEIVPNNSGNTLETLISQPSTSNTGVYNTIYGNQSTGMANNTQMSNNQSATQSNSGYFPVTGDYWTDVLGRAMSAAIDADDVDAFASLYSMYQDSVSKLQQQQQKSTTGSQKLTATQQRANAAMDSLNRLSNMTPDLGYNLSGLPIIGGIATLGGNDYEGEAKSLAQQIGYMVSGANIKEEEAYNIGKAYVPQPFDSEQTRNQKLQRAYSIIRQYQNGTSEEA